MIRNVWKTSILNALGFVQINLFEAGLRQDAIDRCFADAVHRCVQRSNSPSRRQTDGTDCVNVRLIHRRNVGAVCQQNNLSFRDGLVEVETRNLFAGIDAFDDTGIMGRQDLASGAPIGFETVVAGRIVRGRDHDARVALEITNGEREFRRRTRFREEIDLEPMCRQDGRGQLSEFERSMPSISRDDGSHAMRHVIQQFRFGDSLHVDSQPVC